MSAFGLALGLPIGVVDVRALLAADHNIRIVSMPLVTVIAALGVIFVATAAAWIPARHAAALDPAVTLRSD